MRQIKILFYIFLSTTITLTSCSDDDNDKNSNLTDNEYVNHWIYNQMNEWYLWSADMPSSPNYDTDPGTFFYNLRNLQKDRFSWATDNFDELINWTNAVSTDIGFEYFTIFENDLPAYYKIVYVKPNTDAAAKGLKRGDEITKVGGVSLTMDNYTSLLSSGTGTYSLAINNQSNPIEIHSMTDYPENPVYYSNIYKDGNKTIGYLVYNSFTQDKGDSSGDYNAELMNILTQFYNSKVTDLVLDLRYNGGGLVKCAQNLASAIVKNRDSKNLFIKNEYNANITKEINAMSPSRQDEWLHSYFLNKYENVGSTKTGDIPRLGDYIDKVYILTGKYTASSSELIINGLKPYMDVVLIGQTTYGKNVASISLYEENDNRNKWGLQPIIMKMYNSDNQSNYDGGFDTDVEIDEFAYDMKQLGDKDEILLKTAIDKITGRETSALRTSTTKNIKAVSPATKRKGALDMFIDNSFAKEINQKIQ